jgi:hypothetical protein
MENRSCTGSKDVKPVNFGRGTFTAEEESEIETALRKRLGPAFISQRPAGGGKLLFLLKLYKTRKILY